MGCNLSHMPAHVGHGQLPTGKTQNGTTAVGEVQPQKQIGAVAIGSKNSKDIIGRKVVNHDNLLLKSMEKLLKEEIDKSEQPVETSEDVLQIEPDIKPESIHILDQPIEEEAEETDNPEELGEIEDSGDNEREVDKVDLGQECIENPDSVEVEETADVEETKAKEQTKEETIDEKKEHETGNEKGKVVETGEIENTEANKETEEVNKTEETEANEETGHVETAVEKGETEAKDETRQVQETGGETMEVEETQEDVKAGGDEEGEKKEESVD